MPWIHRALAAASEEGAVQVGRLGIPLRAFASVASALVTQEGMGDRASSGEDLSELLLPIATRVADAYDAASSFHDRWRDLRSGLLPIEPELLAWSVVFARAARSARADLRRSASGTSHFFQAYCEAAMQMVGSHPK